MAVKKRSEGSVGEGIVTKNADWNFNGNVTKNFSEHVRRSVPFYDEGHDLVCKLSDFFVTSESESVCYELGTSNADLLIKLAKHNSHKKNIHWIGIDKVEEMIKTAKKKSKRVKNIELVVDDIVNYEYKPTDFIVSYYTVQFVPPRVRQDLFNKIYGALNWGGAFVLFEKVRAPDARFQDMMSSIYVDYKLERGFSPDEIVNKSRSLKGVLEPFSEYGNLGLLKRAGFVDIMTVMKYVCFQGILAIK
jgi:tRNA (cmo5U34)-methyltransferase